MDYIAKKKKTSYFVPKDLDKLKAFAAEIKADHVWIKGNKVSLCIPTGVPICLEEDKWKVHPRWKSPLDSDFFYWALQEHMAEGQGMVIREFGSIGYREFFSYAIILPWKGTYTKVDFTPVIGKAMRKKSLAGIEFGDLDG